MDDPLNSLRAPMVIVLELPESFRELDSRREPST